MLHTAKKLADRYNGYMINLGKKRALEVLLNTSDRMLEDAGFSRELLEQGVKAWPWKLQHDEQQLEPLGFEELANERAVGELETLSERELHDLGIARGSIKEAVQNGRRNIERHDERKVA